MKYRLGCLPIYRIMIIYIRLCVSRVLQSYCKDIPEETILSGMVSDTFQFGYVIEGYEYLTIEDVFYITIKDDRTYFDIESRTAIRKIFSEYIEFTKPLVKNIEEDTRERVT